MTGPATPYHFWPQSGSGIPASSVQDGAQECPPPKKTRANRPKKLMARRPLELDQPLWRVAHIPPHRARWHITDEGINALCGRQSSAELCQTTLVRNLEDDRLICRPCWGKFSWQPMPHDYEERDCGYETPCWIWMRGADRDGYGKRCIPDGSRAAAAHRGAYEAAHGEIPDGFVVHHRCDQPACVNPDHLEAMSRADHVRLHRAGKPLIGGRRV